MDGLVPLHYDFLIDIESAASVEDHGSDQAIVDIGIASASWCYASKEEKVFDEPTIFSNRWSIDIREYATGGRWYRRFNVSIDTMLWWATQDAKVRARVFGGDLQLVDALRGLGDFVCDVVGEGRGDLSGLPISVWGKPAIFDLVALRNAYRTTDVYIPWNWRSERCLSTIAYEMQIQSDASCISGKDDTSKQKHNPEYDARRDLSIICNWRRQYVWPRLASNGG